MRSAANTFLFLSRLVLSQRSRQVVSELARPYEMHRTLMRAFPQASGEAGTKARDEYSMLFRTEAEDSHGRVIVFVQSLIEPKWSFLDGLNGYLRVDTEMPRHECKDIMPAYRGIKNGQVLWFRLRANPTKRVAKEGDPMKGKRVELMREEDQIDWLMRKGSGKNKATTGGFDLLVREVAEPGGEMRLVPYVTACSEGKQVWRKKGKPGAARAHTTTHLSVLFEGLLRVTDTEAFLETLVRGIGAGKAFGFGLLSVAPISI